MDDEIEGEWELMRSVNASLLTLRTIFSFQLDGLPTLTCKLNYPRALCQSKASPVCCSVERLQSHFAKAPWRKQAS